MKSKINFKKIEQADEYMKKAYGITLSELYSKQQLTKFLTDDDIVSLCEWCAEKYELKRL